MFDIKSRKSDVVLINSISFRHTQTESSSISLYTAEGSFFDIATTEEEWAFVQNIDIEIGNRKGGYATVEFEIPVAISAGSTRAFYIASPGKLISGHHEEEGADYLAIDDTLIIKTRARIVGSQLFGGGMKGSW